MTAQVLFRIWFIGIVFAVARTAALERVWLRFICYTTLSIEKYSDLKIILYILSDILCRGFCCRVLSVYEETSHQLWMMNIACRAAFRASAVCVILLSYSMMFNYERYIGKSTQISCVGPIHLYIWWHSIRWISTIYSIIVIVMCYLRYFEIEK